MDDIDLNDLEWLYSYYLDKKSKRIISARPLKDNEIPEDVKEHFRKLGYMEGE